MINMRRVGVRVVGGDLIVCGISALVGPVRGFAGAKQLAKEIEFDFDFDELESEVLLLTNVPRAVVASFYAVVSPPVVLHLAFTRNGRIWFH